MVRTAPPPVPILADLPAASAPLGGSARPLELLWQPSLLDAVDAPSLVGVPGGRGLAGVVRTELSHGAWLDQACGVVAGAAALFEEVLAAAPWSSNERPMYDRMVVEPRLTTHRWADPPASVRALADAVSSHYRRDLQAISANLYRDGQDSVAWHGDRIRHVRGETVVAIVSLGSARRFLLRPRAAAPPSGW